MLKFLLQDFLFSFFLLSLVLSFNDFLDLKLLDEFFPYLMTVLFLSVLDLILGKFFLKINVFFVLKLFEHVLLYLFLQLFIDLFAGS